jgi:LysM repeat protein
MKFAAGIPFLILLGGCASPSKSTQKESAAVSAELAVAQQKNQSLDSVIHILRPEAFEEVGLYRIEPGDTGLVIARKHKLRLDELVALNPDVNWNKLRVDQVVRVRAVEEKTVEPAATAQRP